MSIDMLRHTASADQFQETFEQVPAGMAQVGLDGQFLKVNSAFRAMLGYASAPFEPLTLAAIIHPDDRAAHLDFMDELRSGAREQRALHRDGHIVWISLRVALIRTAQDTPDYVMAVIEDVQEKKNAESALAQLQQRLAVEAQLRASGEHIHTILEASHDAFIGIDSAGNITQWNRAAERIFRWSAAEVLGQNLKSTIIPAQYHQAHQNGLDRFLATGEGPVINQRIELPARTKDGRTIPVEMTISPHRVDGQLFFGAFLHDISERKETAARLERKQHLLDAILNSVDVGVIACNERGEITLFNHAAARMHGIEPQASRPEDWAQAYDLLAADGATPLPLQETPLYRALRGERVDNAEIALQLDGQATRHLFASGQRLTSSSGQSMGAVMSFKDVTTLKNLESQRALNESRLRAITENIPALIGQVDRDNQVIFLNRHALRFYGRPAAELIGHDVSVLYSADEYRRIKPFIDSARAGMRASFESTLEVAGSLRHYSAVYIPEQGPGAEPCGFYAMAMDITARKNSEILQAESEERLRTITDNLPVLIAYVDADEVYRFANATHEKWLRRPLSAIIGKTVQQVFPQDMYNGNKAYLRQNLAGTATRFETAYTFHGATRHAQVVGIPHLSKGAVVGAYVMITDITDNKRHEAQLQTLARCDPLTGLPNRRRFEEILHEASLRATRTRTALALMYLDVDFFKQINDTFGHAGGDEVLKQFADRLRLAVRATDTVCRLAGDEFTIILEGVQQHADAAHVADKILLAFAAPMQIGPEVQHISTSIGIACHGAGQIDTARLGKEADDALYQSKAAGRNRYTLAASAPL